MSEKEFYQLLIDMIRRENHPQKAKLLDILSRATLSCDKTEEFTHHRWNYFKEYIYINVIPTDMNAMLDFQQYVESVLKRIYPVNEQYTYEFFGLEIKPRCVMANDSTSQAIHFEDIQEQIINELRLAKYTIWIAMAWFTNKQLFDVLKEKKRQGVNVQIVIDDNDRNRDAYFSLDSEF